MKFDFGRFGGRGGRILATSAFSCRHRNFSNLVPNDSKRQLPQEYKQGHIDRFALPSNPNEFLVEKAKLTGGESAYQYFAAGFPWIILITFTSFPAAIATYWYMSRDRWKQKLASALPEEEKDAVTAFKISLPTEIAAKDLEGLLATSEPTVIVYFNTNDHEKSLLNKLALLLLSEIANLPGCRLKVKRLNVTEQQKQLPAELKKELENSSDSIYLQLVIPNTPEPLVAKIDAAVSVESFSKQVKGFLQHFNLHDKYKPHPQDVKRLDSKLQRVKQCLFQLEVDGSMDKQYQKLVNVNNFDALVQACTLATAANSSSVARSSCD